MKNIKLCSNGSLGQVIDLACVPSLVAVFDIEEVKHWMRLYHVNEWDDRSKKAYRRAFAFMNHYSSLVLSKANDGRYMPEVKKLQKMDLMYINAFGFHFMQTNPNALNMLNDILRSMQAD